MANKFCSNCRHAELFDDEEPCLTCDGDNGRHINWQPPESDEACESALAAARRAGKAEGLREALDAIGPVPPTFDGMSENARGWRDAIESVHAEINTRIARAEEVERE